MKRYFVNPELKVSSFILLALMTVFFIVAALILKLNHDRLKEEYINTIGAITVRVVEKNPELQKEIASLITKEISKEEAIKGEMFLSQYGLTKDLETELFPYLSSTTLKNSYSFILMFITMAIVLFMLNYFQYSMFYERVRTLTQGARKVVEGDYNITINENKEGDFSKLAVSFNSMKDIIRNNINELTKEKQFLVELLSDISHQLKTPLSSMILYNDIMVNKELTKEQRETFLLNNQNQLHRMNWLIQSMLKLAKLDAKAIELDKEYISLNESLEEAIEVLHSKAVEEYIDINFEQTSEIFLKHDRLWLEEAFINIIKNGIEHTKSGGKIKIELVENSIYTRVVIEDNGEGIKEEDLPNIFKRFYKAGSVKVHDSVGIGLALSKSIIELHGGIIEVKSKIDIGTKFIISFLKY